ncbi:MAG: molybdenum ABC transporter ATP-binding protein [Methylophaga sp.]|nr:MAG: molybdenum ABC transporter ATP-binding protein [Methylophaga sp.]
MTAPAYQLHNIKVHYKQRCVLDIDKLSLQQNQCIALLGDNGAGKSTLLNLLAFTAQANEGEILLAGQQVSYPLSTTHRQSIGYVSQHPLLLQGSVRDNIMLALKLQGIGSQHHKELTQTALAQVNLEQLADQSTATLSGGELKRAAIARAISYQPDILLLDEPFSHLDQHHYQQLETILLQLSKQNKTVIFSTHNRLQGLALADSSINLVNGRVTSTPLLNLFHGNLHHHIFDTGKLQIYTTSNIDNAHNIAIDPNEIIISKHALESSMRNCFSGRLTLIAEEIDSIRLTVDCGEIFHALISQESLTQLALSLGDTVYLSFKSTATKVF